MLRWVRLKKVDNWGEISYEWSDKRFKKPSHVIVQWPSGKYERCKVVAHSHSDYIMDMGHRYTVCTTLWFVKTDHNGLMIEIPIEKVGIAVEDKKILTKLEGV